MIPDLFLFISPFSISRLPPCPPFHANIHLLSPSPSRIGMLGGFRSIIGGYDLSDEGGYRKRRQQPDQPSRFDKAKRTGIDPLYGVSLG